MADYIDKVYIESDGTVTGHDINVADHAITMEKTDFYYQKSMLYEPSWMAFSGGVGQIGMVNIAEADLATANTELPDTLSIVIETTTTYWKGNLYVRFKAGSSTYTNVTNTTHDFTVNGTQYGVIEIAKEDWQSAYQTHESHVTGGAEGHGFDIIINAGGSYASRIAGKPFAVSSVVTADLIEAEFTEPHLSADFATAVNYVLESGEGSSASEELAKQRLSGKVMICLGDSYTVGMGSQLSAIASKYEMAYDARGLVSSPITGTTNTSPRPFWYRADTIVSDYANGYVINGTTYQKSDVGVVVFMGGANDGFGVETYIGTGIHETDKTKIYGACGYIFDLLAQTFPNAKFICITQPSNYSRLVSSITSDATAQTLGFENLAELQQMDDIQFSNYAMAQKEEAVKKSAWAYGWAIVDMFNEMPNIFSSANRTAYWNSDKLHLTTAGYTLIANALDKKIVEVVLR